MIESRDLVQLYLKDIKRYKMLTKEEELDLLIKSKAGDLDAKQLLILSNLRLVVNVAKNYMNKGLNYIDLISEGNFGLIHAIEKFDPTKGFRFSTYAVWWIKQAVSKAVINKGREIRIPSYKYDILNKINKYIMNYVTKYDVFPNIKDISKSTKISEDKIEKVMIEFQELLSLNSSIGEDIFLEDIVSTENSEFLEDSIIDGMFKEDMNKRLNVLNPREKEIIVMRYGLNEEENKIVCVFTQFIGIDNVKFVKKYLPIDFGNKKSSSGFNIYYSENRLGYFERHKR